MLMASLLSALYIQYIFFKIFQGQTSPVQSFPHRKARPQRPNMSPSSMRKETERIAKIFAANFDGNQ